ncbi:MAG: nicotinate (nicotinamide) nucleotide adenylyltransferase [Bacteroidales bacterium]|nr:nicotinate (nicotinamide) nucleotide adenylyltransferase [Bacteroidales bacterium]
MKIGLYFGSFNPIHIGHMAIANYVVEFAALDQVWFIVSPHNPLKEKSSLLQDFHRLEMVYKAIDDDPRFRASDIEFNMPKPSYTIDTLAYLKEKFPDYAFHLIMGSDNLYYIHKWKNYKEILSNYGILVYPRPDYPFDIKELSDLTGNDSSIRQLEAPLMEISSSFIRKSIKQKIDLRHFLPAEVFRYIEEMHFYE